MVHDEEALTKLGRRIGETLGEGPSADRREAQRRAVVGAMRSGTTRKRSLRTPLAVVAGLGAAAAAVVLLWVLHAPAHVPAKPAATIAFQVEGRGPGAVGHWLEAQEGTLVLRFVGGTRMAFEPDSRAQVVQSDEQRVAVRLDHGRLLADVQHRGATSWNVVAGPYRVTVVGTKFRVRWDAAAGTLRVSVVRGRVRVTGEELSDGGVVLAAREELRVNRHTNRWTVTRAPVATRTEPAPELRQTARPAAPRPAMARPAAVPSTAPSTAPPTRVPARTATSLPAWKSLLQHGRTVDAVKAAERLGIARLAATLPPRDLWRLARAGRVARRGATAQQLLEAYRRRFSGSANARTAAFLLGRVAMELRGDPGAAATWFRRYLRDAPTGPLAEEALGRYIGSSHRAGAHAAARRAAQRYLQRYPKGIYRSLARKVRQGP